MTHPTSQDGCKHETLIRAKTGGWYCISRTGCDFAIPEHHERSATLSSKQIAAWLVESGKYREVFFYENVARDTARKLISEPTTVTPLVRAQDETKARLCPKCNRTVTEGCNYVACPYPLPNPPGCICRYAHPSDPMCTYSPEKTLVAPVVPAAVLEQAENPAGCGQ